MLLGACREVGRGQSQAPQHPPAHECLSNGLITPMKNPAQVSSLMAGGTSKPSKIPHYPRGEGGQNGECFPGKIPRACPGARKSALSPQPGAQDEASDPIERQGRQGSLPQGDRAAQKAVLTVAGCSPQPPRPRAHSSHGHRKQPVLPRCHAIPHQCSPAPGCGTMVHMQ